MKNYLTGIIASSGIAIGKAYIYEKTKIDVNKTLINNEDISANIKKIDQALHDYSKELGEQVGSTVEIQAVIDAHKELVLDPYLKDTIHSKIEDKNYSADYALQQTIEEMVSMMLMLDDSYMRERALDYKDIGEQLMYKVKEIIPKSLANLEEEVIVIAEELTPSDTSTMKRNFVLGFANDLGGKTSHTSIIAQTLSIPAIVGMKDVTKQIKDGQMLILDAIEGKVFIDPDEETLDEYQARKQDLEQEQKRLEQIKDKAAVTLDNRQIEVVCNIGNLEDLEIGLEGGAEGVGLFRTEFLYMESNAFPDEERQFKSYKAAAERLEGKPLIIRTLDIGGDKSLPYFEFPKEENPFLGWRALRISFDLEQVFRTQLRAILRASAFGNVKILLPMIISVEEMIYVQELVKKYKEELTRENQAFDPNIELGVMIETPASVFIAQELIEHCDFFSIGTNDLTQYILAVDRGNEKISKLFNNYHPAVLRAIKHVIDASHEAGKWTGMCGGMASDIHATYLLLGMGLDEFSAVGSQIGRIKDIIVNANYEEAKAYADRVLSLGTVSEVEKMINANV